VSTPNLNDLDPDSPEYEAALMAAQQAEDEANDNAEQQRQQEGEGDEPEPDGAPPADEAAPNQAAADEAKPEKPIGVLSKDGTRVLPYAALKGARKEAQSEREARIAAEARAAAAEQAIADLKAGKPQKPAGLTPERIEELVTDFPETKELVDELNAAREKLKQAPAAQPAAAEDQADPIQDAIDDVPLLATWQVADREKFARAVEHDKVLQTSPKWKDRPMAERFAHVARLVADEFDVPVEEDPPSQNTPTRSTRKQPEEVIREARRTTPNTLSDFKGGAADPAKPSIERATPQRQVNQFADMTDEQIDAHLARLG